MKTDHDLDPFLENKLKKLIVDHSRNAASAESGKSNFLIEARQLAVTYTGLQRLNLWKEEFFQTFRRKEKAPMLTTFISLFLVFATLLGGGISVVAAQSSQPTDWLYPVKTISEDAFYQLVPGDQNHFNLSLIYSDRRMAEIQTMLEEGQIPPDAVTERLRIHLQKAFELSVKNFADTERMLEQIQLQLEEQLRTRLQQTKQDPAIEALRLQIREMLQERIGWANAGQEQFAMLRQQTQNQQQTQNDQQAQNGQQTQNQLQNQSQYSWSATPTFQNQYGGNEGNGANGGAGFGNGPAGWTPPWDATPTPMGYQFQNQNGTGGQGR